MTQYITSCNLMNFDIITCLSKSKFIYWKQNRNYSIDDIVFFYVGKPYSRLMFCFRVVEINIESPKTLYEYYKQQEKGRYKNNPYVKLELLYELPEKGLSLKELLAHGLKTVQCTTKADDELISYIDIIYSKHTEE